MKRDPPIHRLRPVTVQASGGPVEGHSEWLQYINNAWPAVVVLPLIGKEANQLPVDLKIRRPIILTCPIQQASISRSALAQPVGYDSHSRVEAKGHYVMLRYLNAVTIRDPPKYDENGNPYEAHARLNKPAMSWSRRTYCVRSPVRIFLVPWVSLVLGTFKIASKIGRLSGVVWR